MPSDTIIVAFRRKDIRKIADFCVKNKIPVVPMEKDTNWEEILGKALDSPVLVEAVKLMDHYIAYKKENEGENGNGKNGKKKKKVIDVDYEEVDETEKDVEEEDAK